METVAYDHRFSKPPPETWAKILSSREEAAAMALRELKCPICGYKLFGVYGHTGYVNVKCQKCKFTGPLNLAYFHRQKRSYRYRGDWNSPFSR